MNQAERDQHEIEIAANKLFPGWIRRVELLQHDDAPMIEPGQLMPRLVFTDPADHLQDPHPDPRKVAKAARTFKLAVGPGLNQFRHDLLKRWPEIDEGVIGLVAAALDQYRFEAADLIAQTVAGWDPEAAAQRLELAIGRDLQFIRINGTLVGGLVGLLIYTVSRFWH